MASRRGEWIGVALWAIALGIPAVLDTTWVSVAAIFAIYAITALSEDIILGRGGMFDMGHAAYLGIGAYITAILNVTFGWPIFATMPVAVVLSAAVGALLAGPLIDRFGFAHDAPNLGIVGTSVFPTSGGHNPTLTLQALALRTARRLVDSWGAIALPATPSRNQYEV